MLPVTVFNFALYCLLGAVLLTYYICYASRNFAWWLSVALQQFWVKGSGRIHIGACALAWCSGGVRCRSNRTKDRDSYVWRWREGIAGSLGIGLFGGRIIIKDLLYVTENFSVRVTQLTLVYRWWRRDVLESTDGTSSVCLLSFAWWA